MEVYLVRHGQSVNNALMENQLLRVADPELTEIGKQQAQHTAHHLANALNLEHWVIEQNGTRQGHYPYGITHLYCSAMHRALQTAAPIAKALGLKTEIWLELHEIGGIYLEKEGVVTGYGGRTRQQIITEFPDYVLPDTITDQGWWNPSHGREDMSLCQARAVRVAAMLKQRALVAGSKRDRLALIVHGTFMDALMKAFLNTLPGGSYYHWHYNCAITRLDFDDTGRFLIRYLNRVEHLPPDLITT